MSKLTEKLRERLRKSLPPAMHRKLQKYYHRAKYGTRSRADSFTHIYKTNNWGSDESRSGPGSSMMRTESIRHRLKEFISKNNCQAVVDLGCGDFNWMKHLVIPEQFKYTGCDIVEEIIEENSDHFGSDRISFLVLDAVEEVPPGGDLLICREMLIHLSNEDVIKALRNIALSGSNIVLLTHDDKVANTEDIPSGSYRNINLCASPFNLPAPDFRLEDSSDRSLAGWSHENLARWDPSAAGK